MQNLPINISLSSEKSPQYVRYYMNKRQFVLERYIPASREQEQQMNLERNKLFQEEKDLKARIEVKEETDED